MLVKLRVQPREGLMKLPVLAAVLLMGGLCACDEGSPKGMPPELDSAFGDMEIEERSDAMPALMDSGVEVDGGGVVDPCPERRMEGPLMITTNEELEGLRGVTIIEQGQRGQALVIEGNEITDLSALECLKFIPDGAMRIGPLPNLASLEGLERLTQLVALTIYENGVTSLRGLESLQELETLTLFGLDALETLDGLNPEHRVTRQISVTGVANLVDASSLGPYEITQLLLAQNDRLEKVPNVRLVRAEQLGGLELSNLGSLRTLDGLSVASEILGSVEIERLPRLESLSALEELTGIFDPNERITEKLLSLTHLPLITDLSGLGALREVAGFAMSNLSGLEALDGLRSLEIVNGNIWVTNNRSLRSMEGLADLTIRGERINIEGNESLPRCAIDALVQGWRDNGYTGSVDLEGLQRCDKPQPSDDP
jgi:hypothetical protein